MKIKRILSIFLFILGVVLIILGLFQGNMDFIARTATYGNFDVPGVESWVMKLKPGVADLASRIQYGSFNKVPLISIGILFIAVLFISIYRNKKDFIRRKIMQWLIFVVARLGVLRVSGICPVKRTELGAFPFLNCMACEMATGACPIGMLQKSLMERKIPYMVLGVLFLSGAAFGRVICGWICPFGFVADMLDRINIKKVKIPSIANYFKYAVFVFLFSAILWTIPIFCIVFCESGVVLGLMPYYLTTGLPALKEVIITGIWVKSFVIFHLIVLLILIIGVIFVSGRWFCRYICPLGAWYGLFNYVSPICIEHDHSKCTKCEGCTKVCPMGVDLGRGKFKDITGCIRCGRCTKLCEARRFAIKLNKKEELK